MKSQNAVPSTDTTRHEVEKFVVRLPMGMRARIADVARTNHRSMNSEIITRLEDSLNGVSTVEPSALPSASTPALRVIERASDKEQRLLARFRSMSADKQTALLELLGQ